MMSTPTNPAPRIESVWDYPRPPRVEPVPRRIRVVFGGVAIAETVAAMRVLETSHPPVYYLPPEDVRWDFLVPAPGRSWCEWKGEARYFDIEVSGRRAPRAAWTYQAPTAEFAAITGCVAYYAGPMDACFVGDARVLPQPGGFYGGWITPEIRGPFKGTPGTAGW